jgi:hypothetical protein
VNAGQTRGCEQKCGHADLLATCNHESSWFSLTAQRGGLRTLDRSYGWVSPSVVETTSYLHDPTST